MIQSIPQRLYSIIKLDVRTLIVRYRIVRLSIRLAHNRLFEMSIHALMRESFDKCRIMCFPRAISTAAFNADKYWMTDILAMDLTFRYHAISTNFQCVFMREWIRNFKKRKTRFRGGKIVYVPARRTLWFIVARDELRAKTLSACARLACT